MDAAREDLTVPDLKLLPLHGLWLSPSAINAAPPGSMQVCEDIVFREAGVLEPLPNDIQFAEDQFTQFYEPKKMFDARVDQMLTIAKHKSADTWEARWLNVNTGGSPTRAKLYGADPVFQQGKVQSVTYPGADAADGLLYVTSAQGLLRFDVTTQTLIQRAGLSPPMGPIGAILASGSGRAFGADQSANYRAIFKRTFADGTTREYTSAPSTPILVWNFDPVDRNVAVLVGWASGLDEIEVLAGSELTIELYRTRTVPNGREPGDRMFLVGSAVVDAGTLATRTVTIVDRIKNNELGEALYTNTGQEGIGAARYMPPLLADVTEYKGTLYGIATDERQSISLYVGVPWGQLTTAEERENGIGERVVTGTVVIGLATITGVSATDDKGIAVGQLVTSAGWPANTRVLSFVAGTITMDQNATGTPPTTTIVDQIEIDGTLYNVTTPVLMYTSFHAGSTFQLEATFSQPLTGMTGSGVVVQTGLGFGLARPYVDDLAFGVRATSGSKYSPPLNGLAGALVNSSPSTEQNRLGWCANNQPDHWPLGNRETLGNGAILRLIATAETMFAFTTEGRVYRISGFDSNLVVDVILEGTYLGGVNAVATYQGSVYAWTNRGLLEIGDGGLQFLSTQVKRSLEIDYDQAVEDQAVAGNLFNFDAELQMEEFHGEVWLRPKNTVTNPDGDNPAYGPCLIYNLQNREWSQCVIPFAAYRYSYDQRVIVFADEQGETYFGFALFTNLNNAPVKTGNARFVLNRHDGGEPGVLKQFRETVLLFQKSSTAPTLSVVCNSYVDTAAGGGTNGSNEAPVLNADDPTPHTVYTPREATLATQWWFEFQMVEDSAQWALDGLVLRVVPSVDRTGRAEN